MIFKLLEVIMHCLEIIIALNDGKKEIKREIKISKPSQSSVKK